MIANPCTYPGQPLSIRWMRSEVTKNAESALIQHAKADTLEYAKYTTPEGRELVPRLSRESVAYVSNRAAKGRTTGKNALTSGKKMTDSRKVNSANLYNEKFDTIITYYLFVLANLTIDVHSQTD